jgi:hypothetical protein
MTTLDVVIVIIFHGLLFGKLGLYSLQHLISSFACNYFFWCKSHLLFSSLDKFKIKSETVKLVKYFYNPCLPGEIEWMAFHKKDLNETNKSEAYSSKYQNDLWPTCSKIIT